MPQIIALEGNPSSGKSTTIGILYDGLLQPNGYNIVQDRKIRGSKDFFVIVEKKGKIIGVTTYGDTRAIIQKKIDFFIGMNCSIIVIACRPSSRGDGTKEMIDNYAGFTKQYLPKLSEPNAARRPLEDTIVAQNLFTMLENVL